MRLSKNPTHHTPPSHLHAPRRVHQQHVNAAPLRRLVPLKRDLQSGQVGGGAVEAGCERGQAGGPGRPTAEAIESTERGSSA